MRNQNQNLASSCCRLQIAFLKRYTALLRELFWGREGECPEGTSGLVWKEHLRVLLAVSQPDAGACLWAYSIDRGVPVAKGNHFLVRCHLWKKLNLFRYLTFLVTYVAQVVTYIFLIYKKYIC